MTLRWTVDCGPDGLAGRDDRHRRSRGAAKINALAAASSALDGDAIQTVLGPRQPVVHRARHAPTRSTSCAATCALGVEHILTGPDHLLFVFGLLLLVSTSRLLVQTITAFTLGHSITLSAAALGLAHVPPRPVEVLIALSVLVARRRARARRPTEPTLLRRFPWAMALAFGLLHGFGFAGALAEAGLPAGESRSRSSRSTAASSSGSSRSSRRVLGVGAAARRAGCRRSRRARTRAAVYAMGILAAFWCFERLALWLA